MVTLTLNQLLAEVGREGLDPGFDASMEPAVRERKWPVVRLL